MQVMLPGLKGLLHNAQQLPVPLRWMKRWWRGGKDGGVKRLSFLKNYSLFLSVHKFSFVGGTARMSNRLWETGRWAGSGNLMWNSQIINLKRKKRFQVGLYYLREEFILCFRFEKMISSDPPFLIPNLRERHPVPCH